MEKEIENLKERIRTTSIYRDNGVSILTEISFNNQIAIMQSLIAIMQKLDKIETK